MPAQQPFGHDVPSQTQTPPLQRWPAPQGGPLAPQAQVPFGRQRSAFAPQVVHAPPPVPQLPTPAVRQLVPEQQPLAHDTPSQTQAPLTQCWPAAHGAPPLPHTQAPFGEQWSDRTGSQGLQAPPPLPHASIAGGWQLPPLQQPVGHEVASHTHAPATQR